ncbi:MAG TPA: hypothetical protein EYP60_04455 [bacterium (Candidatus Stahlbacteria)]|nr:hypothetical protein [Candidatus Stahlbacteria bacterium]
MFRKKVIYEKARRSGVLPNKTMKRRKNFKKVRFPLPPKSEHPHSTKKGKKGYNRRKAKEEERQAIYEALEEEGNP